MVWGRAPDEGHLGWGFQESVGVGQVGEQCRESADVSRGLPVPQDPVCQMG